MTKRDRLHASTLGWSCVGGLEPERFARNTAGLVDLAAQHQLTRTEYRVRWGLSPEHPLTAPAYGERRSEYAKQTGLGRRPQAEAETDGAKKEVAAPKARQRRKGGSTRRRNPSAVPS